MSSPTAAAATPRTTKDATPIGVWCPYLGRTDKCQWQSPKFTKINAADEAQKLILLHFTLCKTNSIVIQERKACKHQRQLRQQRLKRQDCTKQTASREQLEKQNLKAENPATDLWSPNDMVKTPEDSHTEGLANNNTNPPTSNTSKLGSNTVTLNPRQTSLWAQTQLTKDWPPRAVQEPQHRPEITRKKLSTKREPIGKELQTNDYHLTSSHLTPSQEQQTADYRLLTQAKLQAKCKLQAEIKL